MSRFQSTPKSRFPRAALPVTEALARNDAFSRLAAGVEQLTELKAQLMDALPNYLQAEVEPAMVRDGVLVLLTRHNALAARLRHLEPALVAQLQRRGWAIDSLKIRVRPLAAAAPGAGGPKSARLSAAGLACLAALCESTEPSPLKDALARMVARHQENKQGEKGPAQ